MEQVDVIIPTFGDEDFWTAIAQRAFRSAANQTSRPHDIVQMHSTVSVADARNFAAWGSDADWLLFLDADDELDPKYVESMLAGKGDVRWPSTLGIVNGVEDDYPVLLEPQGSFLVRNHCVIGSMIKRELFVEIGGFRDLPILEDWDLWIRAKLAGADFQPCPDAIYRVHVNPQGMGRNQQAQLHGHIYTEIQQRYQADWYLKGLF